MYNAYFGLTESPFNISPDPAFLYRSQQHEEALANLTYGVKSRKGFIVLSGEVGTGKTMLLECLRDYLEEQLDLSGLLVTKTLLVAGDPLYTTLPGHPRGAMLRAYDKMSGREVGAVWMPAPQSGSPMTYSYGGRQYIIVAVSGGNYSGDYIAYRLPAGN